MRNTLIITLNGGPTEMRYRNVATELEAIDVLHKYRSEDVIGIWFRDDYRTDLRKYCTWQGP